MGSHTSGFLGDRGENHEDNECLVMWRRNLVHRKRKKHGAKKRFFPLAGLFQHCFNFSP